jgi:DNA/RNA endonuclease YhcR with UshA esterase domain
MPAAIGISATWVTTAPTGCVINEATKEQSKDIKTIKNASGVTIQAAVIAMTTTKISVKGKGIPSLSSVAAVASFTSGTAYATSVSVDESNDDFPSFTLESTIYS